MKSTNCCCLALGLRVIAFGLLLTLTACAGSGQRSKHAAGSPAGQPAAQHTDTTAELDATSAWQQRREQLRDMDSWSMFGRLAMRSDTESFTAHIQWRQTGDAYRVRLSGPFGAGTLQIEGDAQGVVLRTNDDQSYVSSTPEELLYQHTGWWLPLSGLRYWVLGRTEPERLAEMVTIDEQGLVQGFQQDGWDVRYLDYRSVDEFHMPRKASLQSERVRASLLVTRWQLELADIDAAGTMQTAANSDDTGETVTASEQGVAEQTTGSAAAIQTPSLTEDAGNTISGSQTSSATADAVESSSPVISPEQRWRQRRELLLDMETWSTFGRVSISGNGPAWSSMLEWRQNGENYLLRLTEPLAAGGVELEGTSRRTELRTSDYQTHRGRQPGALLQRHLGFGLPIQGLRYWLLGRARPQTPVNEVFIDPHGRVLYFEQDGWRVEYGGYTPSVPTEMPNRVTLIRDQRRISIVLSSWDTPTP